MTRSTENDLPAAESHPDVAGSDTLTRPDKGAVQPGPVSRLPGREAWQRLATGGGALGRGARLVLLFLVFALISAPYLKHQIDISPQLSPIDETSYTDYLYKVDTGHLILRKGEYVDGWSVREIQCRGVGPQAKPDPAACKGPIGGHGGVNPASIDPPTYYLATDLGSKVVRGLRLTDNLLTAGRYVGLLWSPLTMLALYLLSRFLGASRWVSVLPALLIPFSQTFSSQDMYVTPHSWDALVAVAVVWLVVSWDRGRRGLWALVVAGAIGPWVKGSDVIIGCVAVLYLLAGVWWRRDSADPGHRRRQLTGTAVLAGSLLLASLIWVVAMRLLTVRNSHVFANFDAPRLTLKQFTDTFGLFLSPLALSNVKGIASLIALVMFGVAIGYLMDRRTAPELRRLAFAYLMLAVFGATILFVSTWVLTKQYVPPPPRYSLTLIPLGLALAATRTRGRVPVALATLTVGVTTVLFLTT